MLGEITESRHCEQAKGECGHLGLFEFRGATHLDPREILGRALTLLPLGTPMTQGVSLRASTSPGGERGNLTRSDEHHSVHLISSATHLDPRENWGESMYASLCDLDTP